VAGRPALGWFRCKKSCTNEILMACHGLMLHGDGAIAFCVFLSIGSRLSDTAVTLSAKYVFHLLSFLFVGPGTLLIQSGPISHRIWRRQCFKSLDVSRQMANVVWILQNKGVH